MIILKGQTLQRQIVVATSIMLLALSGAVLWSGNRTRMERQNEIRAEAISIVALAASYLTQYFDGLDAMASVLGRHPAVVAFDAAECDRLFADLIREQPLLLNVTLRDRSGVLRSSGVDSLAAKSSSAPEYLSKVLTTGRPAMITLLAAPVTGKPSIVQGYPVRDANGAVVGVLGFGLNLLQLQMVFDRLPLPEGSVVMMQDEQGRVVAGSRDGQKYLGAAQSLPPRTGTSVHVGADGVERFTAATLLERGPWTLSAGIPRSAAVARLAPMYTRNAIILMAAILAALTMALWLSRHVSNGLNELRAAAYRIAQGDLSPPQKSSAPSLEITALQNAFDSMAASLRDARSALALQIEQERKTREMLQSIQRQMVRQERLAAVGVLASGVAHELNNPLQAILGTAELLERNPELSADALDEISLLKTQSGRARDIIRNLSRFASPQSEPPTLIDLRGVIDEVVQLRGRELQKANIALALDIASTRKVYANTTELTQVTLNFVINAQQAIEEAERSQGRVLIRLCDEGRRVRLEVHDDGPGVSAEHESKLFQPFFTTKPVGKGSGLGLSVSYGIIDSYGGTIGHRANEWHGAVFYFELPAVDGPPTSA